MAVSPKIIYLESDEEITSVVDKLRKTDFKKVVLVIPKEASLLQSVVNLKLLKRQADNLEKQLAVVTGDKVGRALAQKIGILASSKLEEVVNEAEFVPIPFEEKVREEDLTDFPDDSESPLKETKEIIFKNKPDRKSVDEEEDVLLMVKEEPEEPEEEETFSKKVIEEPEEDNLMPKLPKKKVLIVSGLIFLALLTLAYVFIPRARANVLVKAERKPVSIDFRGEKDGRLDTEKAVIPTQVVVAEKELSKKYPTTGKKNVGQKATGTIRISNASGKDISWVAGTRFAPTSNTALIYTSNTAVLAPDGEFTSIIVTASSPGDQYNGYGSNQAFTLVSGGLSSTVTITSKDGMSGGSNKEVSYVAQGDINSAKDALKKDATDEATTEFNKKAEGSKIVDETKKEEVLSSAASPSLNGEATEFTMTVKVKVTALAYKSQDIADLIKAETARELGFVKEIIDDGSTSASISIDETDMDKGTLSGTIKTDAYVSSKIDQEKIKIDLTGLSEAKAEKYLKDIEGVEEAKFEFFPSFIKSFPRIKSHIFIKIEVADKESI